MQQLESSKLFSASLACQNMFLPRYKEGKGPRPGTAPWRGSFRKFGVPAAAALTWAQQGASHPWQVKGKPIAKGG